MSKTVQEIDTIVEKMAEHDKKDQRKEILIHTILATEDQGEVLHSFAVEEKQETSENAKRTEMSLVEEDTILGIDHDNRIVTPPHFLTLSHQKGTTTASTQGDSKTTQSDVDDSSPLEPNIEQLRSGYAGYNDSVAMHNIASQGNRNETTASSLMNGFLNLFSSNSKPQRHMVRIRSNAVISLLFATFAQLDYDKTGQLTTETTYRQFLELYFTTQQLLTKQHQEGKGEPYDEETWVAYKDEFGDILLSSGNEHVNTETYLQLFADFLLDDDPYIQVLETVLKDPESIINKPIIKEDSQ